MKYSISSWMLVSFSEYALHISTCFQLFGFLFQDFKGNYKFGFTYAVCDKNRLMGAHDFNVCANALGKYLTIFYSDKIGKSLNFNKEYLYEKFFQKTPSAHMHILEDYDYPNLTEQNIEYVGYVDFTGLSYHVYPVK